MSRLKRLLPLLLLPLLLSPRASAAQLITADPGIAGLAVVRLTASSAKATWTTARPLTGGVLQYSKKHAFARGIDPFTLRIAVETSEVALAHELAVADIDPSDEWRFLVSYQFDPSHKFDSPIIYPFAAGTAEIGTPH